MLAMHSILIEPISKLTTYVGFYIPKMVAVVHNWILGRAAKE